MGQYAMPEIDAAGGSGCWGTVRSPSYRMVFHCLWIPAPTEKKHMCRMWRNMKVALFRR